MLPPVNASHCNRMSTVRDEEVTIERPIHASGNSKNIVTRVYRDVSCLVMCQCYRRQDRYVVVAVIALSIEPQNGVTCVVCRAVCCRLGVIVILTVMLQLCL